MNFRKFTPFSFFVYVFIFFCLSVSGAEKAETSREDRLVIDMINRRVPTAFYQASNGVDIIYYNIEAEKAAKMVSATRNYITKVFERLGLQFKYSIHYYIVEGVPDEERYDLSKSIMGLWDSGILFPIFVDSFGGVKEASLLSKINVDNGQGCVSKAILCTFMDFRYRPNFKMDWSTWDNMFFSTGVSLVGSHGYTQLLRETDGIKYKNRDSVEDQGNSELEFSGRSLVEYNDLADRENDSGWASYMFWSAAYDEYGSDFFVRLMSELKKYGKVSQSRLKQCYKKVTNHRIEDDIIRFKGRNITSSHFPY